MRIVAEVPEPSRYDEPGVSVRTTVSVPSANVSAVGRTTTFTRSSPRAKVTVSGTSVLACSDYAEGAAGILIRIDAADDAHVARSGEERDDLDIDVALPR